MVECLHSTYIAKGHCSPRMRSGLNRYTQTHALERSVFMSLSGWLLLGSVGCPQRFASHLDCKEPPYISSQTRVCSRGKLLLCIYFVIIVNVSFGASFVTELSSVVSVGPSGERAFCGDGSATAGARRIEFSSCRLGVLAHECGGGGGGKTKGGDQDNKRETRLGPRAPASINKETDRQNRRA